MSSSSRPSVRPATIADEAFLLALTRRLADFAVPPWRTRAEIADADHGILREALHRPSEKTCILIAEAPPGQPVGCIFLTTRTDYFTGVLHGHIEVVAVTPEAAGRGIGRALLDAGERWARDRGYPQVTLNVFWQNEAARTVYDRLGYRPETIHYRKALE